MRSAEKSLTDAVTKAASWLGIGADVHLGLWDDNKYTNNLRLTEEAEKDATARRAALSKPFAYIASNGTITHSANAAAWKA